MTSRTASWTRPHRTITKGSSVCSGRAGGSIVGQSWWPEELPSEDEYAEARRNLDAHGWAVDLHHHPQSAQQHRGELGPSARRADGLPRGDPRKARYRQWLFGHCHGDRAIDEKHLLLWEQIVRVI